MLEDFLFAQALAWSDRKISFPSLRQQGYAYFNSNQYGHLPGSFFGITGMWPWLDKGILSVDHIQIDWLAARKDGMLGVALMNESVETVTSGVTLGPKAGGNYTGRAQLFDKNGSVEDVHIRDGKLNLTIPGRTLVGLLVPIDAVKAPSFARAAGTRSKDMVSTVVEHANGKGLVMQLSPEKYFGYIYSAQQPDELKSLTVDYRIGEGRSHRMTTYTYPFEFIIEVDNPEKPLTYSLTFEHVDGQIVESEMYVLKPL